MTPQTTTIAVLGQGSIGRRHAGLLVAEGCEVVAYDPLPAAEEVAGVRRVDGPEAALQAAVAAVVATPSVHHLEHAGLALDHGCHVLVEKPIAASADGVEELIERAAAAGRVLAVGMNLRFHPGPATVRRLLGEGAIGRPLLAHATFGSWLPGWRPGTDYRQAYSARAELGGGIALDAIHEVDYATWALGDAVEVSGWLGRVSDLELDVEDVALLNLRHAGGTLSTVELDYLDRRYRRGCRVVGADGSIDWRWADERVQVLTADGERSFPAPCDVAPTYRDQARAFLAATARGELDPASPLADARAGLHAVRVVDAARASSADGRRVTLVP
jgi:predicted dehydrogenase